MTCHDAVMPACHAIYLIFVHFLCCYVLSHKFLAVSTREIKHQYKEARGTRPRCNYRKYFACNLAKIHSHVCTGGKGSVLTLKDFSMLECTEGLAYAIHQLFFVLHQPHFSLLLSSTVPWQNQGSNGLWAALPSQPRAVLNE